MSEINPKTSSPSPGKSTRNDGQSVQLPEIGIHSTTIYKNDGSGPNDKSAATIRTKWNFVDFVRSGMKVVSNRFFLKSTNFQIEAKGGLKVLVKGNHITKIQNG